MMTFKGIIRFKVFAEGTKSESERPYMCFENGTQILLYKKSDNPFENTYFNDYKDKSVTVTGDFDNDVFIVSEIEIEAGSGEEK